MVRFLVRTAITAVGVLAVAYLVSGFAGAITGRDH
jgi:uncharacterized membrane protein YvlD (DUF360 family)